VRFIVTMKMMIKYLKDLKFRDIIFMW